MACENCNTIPGSEFCSTTCIPSWERAIASGKIFPVEPKIRIEDILEEEKLNGGLILPGQID